LLGKKGCRGVSFFYAIGKLEHCKIGKLKCNV
jgi:hypothetical protein